jgi:hypothetical protein
MNHLLVFLLTLAGGAQTSVPAPAPSALVVAQPPLRAESALGTWLGSLVQADGTRRPLEVSFTDGLHPQTLFAYFRVSDTSGSETTLRRLGRLANDQLVFDLREGGRVALRLISGRLVGEVVDPAGQLTGKAARGIELTRGRP